MTSERAPSLYQRPLREMTGSLVLLLGAMLLRATWGTMFLPFLVGALFVWFAYLVASGAIARRMKAKSPSEIDRASELLARPLWIDAAASIIQWMIFSLVILLIVTRDVPLQELPKTLGIVFVTAIPLMCAIGFCWTVWERRLARRLLRPSPK